jgi:MOSC domain-containing protein YiiM
MPPRATLAELMSAYAAPGQVVWMGTRPARREPVVEADAVRIGMTGLEGDRRTRPGKRAVTLFQWEHLAVIAALAQQASIAPATLRRNIGIAGFPLAAVRNGYFRLGTAVLQGTGACAPCSRMEEALGPGGYNAVRGHGGICASVVRPGRVRLGDALTPITDEEAEALRADDDEGSGRGR